ncbi:MAG: glycosyltransferase family 2 protein [Candidatus Hodarchaeales archaeon]
MPLHNEQAYLQECLVSLYEYLNSECQNYDIKVLIADDGSTDQSREIYEELSLSYQLKTVRHELGPLGYGNTILTLFREAKNGYDILITFDADLQHAPFTIKEIIDEMVTNPELDLISTSRYLTYRFWKDNTKVPVDRYVTNMFLTKTINELFNIQITDAFCGLKGYRVRILPTEIDHAGYSFPLVFWHYAHQNGIGVKEVETPIIYRIDRRSRGEWKTRTNDYFQKLESLTRTETQKSLIKKFQKQTIVQITEIIDHYTDFPIYTYSDFFKIKWFDQGSK